MSDQANPPLPKLLPRRADSHKGDYGRLLLIGGSRGMAGAIALSGMAALRSGAGLVKVATAVECRDVVATFDPCYMTLGLPCDAGGRISNKAWAEIVEQSEAADVVACGPGLGRSDKLDSLIGQMYAELDKPLVLDADALFALAQQMSELSKPPAPRVLTPHPGEFARLIGGQNVSSAERSERAKELAARLGVVVLLKGQNTVITDGQRQAVNPTGNPGMATGGTGDVLTGVIAALLGQGLSAFDAAQLGAHVHGLAGDLAAAELGQVGLTARDLVNWLPQAFRRLARA